MEKNLKNSLIYASLSTYIWVTLLKLAHHCKITTSIKKKKMRRLLWSENCKLNIFCWPCLSFLEHLKILQMFKLYTWFEEREKKSTFFKNNKNFMWRLRSKGSTSRTILFGEFSSSFSMHYMQFLFIISMSIYIFLKSVEWCFFCSFF